MSKWFDLNSEQEIEAEFNRLNMSELAAKYNSDTNLKGIQRLSSIVNRFELELFEEAEAEKPKVPFGE